MFRAAFPTVEEEVEKAEASYVKNAFEPPGTSGLASGRLRLAGTWITPGCAEVIAPDYRLAEQVAALVKARPDPGTVYRKSTRPAGQRSDGDSPSSNTAVGSPPPASRRAEAGPNKRQRVASPAVASAPAAGSPAPRTSARLKSPAAARAVTPRSSRARATPTRSTPARKSRASAAAAVQPMAVEEDEDEEPEIGGEDADEGLAEGKAIYDQVASSFANGASLTASTRKRTAADKIAEEAVPTMMNLDGPGLQVAPRPIASNSRLNIELSAEQKALAWGTLAFAFGMGVT